MSSLLKAGSSFILASLGLYQLYRGIFNAYKTFLFATSGDEALIGVPAAGSIFGRES